jgi:phosphomannomutase
VRVGFANGDVAHLRPSGNAPQLRVYALAGSEARADEIVRACLAEPDGILRTLTRTYGG